MSKEVYKTYRYNDQKTGWAAKEKAQKNFAKNNKAQNDYYNSSIYKKTDQFIMQEKDEAGYLHSVLETRAMRENNLYSSIKQKIEFSKKQYNNLFLRNDSNPFHDYYELVGIHRKEELELFESSWYSGSEIVFRLYKETIINKNGEASFCLSLCYHIGLGAPINNDGYLLFMGLASKLGYEPADRLIIKQSLKCNSKYAEQINTIINQWPTNKDLPPEQKIQKFETIAAQIEAAAPFSIQKSMWFYQDNPHLITPAAGISRQPALPEKQKVLVAPLEKVAPKTMSQQDITWKAKGDVKITELKIGGVVYGEVKETTVACGQAFIINGKNVRIDKFASLMLPVSIRPGSEKLPLDFALRKPDGSRINADDPAYLHLEYDVNGRLVKLSLPNSPAIAHQAPFGPAIIAYKGGIYTLPVNNGMFQQLVNIIHQNGGIVEYGNLDKSLSISLAPQAAAPASPQIVKPTVVVAKEEVVKLKAKTIKSPAGEDIPFTPTGFYDFTMSILKNKTVEISADSYTAAISFLKRAMLYGKADAGYALAYIYSNGLTGKEDLKEAKLWVAIGAELGSSLCRQLKDRKNDENLDLSKFTKEKYKENSQSTKLVKAYSKIIKDNMKTVGTEDALPDMTVFNRDAAKFASVDPMKQLVIIPEANIAVVASTAEAHHDNHYAAAHVHDDPVKHLGGDGDYY